MFKKYFISFSFFTLSVASLSAKGHLVECRAATGGVKECNPYSERLLIVKEIKKVKQKNKLIVLKTLPKPKKHKMHIISVMDMVDKYVNVASPVRYASSEDLEEKSSNTGKQKHKSLAKELKEERVHTLATLEKIAKKAYEDELESKKELAKKETEERAIYHIRKGDTLSTIAKKFSLSSKTILSLNPKLKKSLIHAGKTIYLPMKQDLADVLATGKYKIKPGDNIGSIAQDFNLSSSDILKYNRLTRKSTIHIGKTLILPFPYKLAELEKKYKAQEAKERAARKKSQLMHGRGKRKLRVTATAYSSHGNQTDSTPFLAAWNNRLRPGMKVIAVSRDLLTTYGLRNGSKVRIAGLKGHYVVRDKMNKRYRKRIDIYMGLDRRRALRWGKRSVIMYY